MNSPTPSAGARPPLSSPDLFSTVRQGATQRQLMMEQQARMQWPITPPPQPRPQEQRQQRLLQQRQQSPAPTASLAGNPVPLPLANPIGFPGSIPGNPAGYGPGFPPAAAYPSNPGASIVMASGGQPAANPGQPAANLILSDQPERVFTDEEKATALLQAAKKLLENDLKADAQDYLDDIVAKYPRTDAAKEAAVLLKTLSVAAVASKPASLDVAAQQTSAISLRQQLRAGPR
jgi:hypothetical protein